METQVRTPQMIFMHPQRLVVPLFQRPYVWNEENQWEPLWNDIVRVAERVLSTSGARPNPHFLGAVVLQQVPNVIGSLQHRTIIDGQQRLTTLQLLLDALHAELTVLGTAQPASRIEPLIENQEAFWDRPEDRFKVWPTNRDRPAFNAVMGHEPPVDYTATGHADDRMVEAHRYFAEQTRSWMQMTDNVDLTTRATALELAVRELLQVVVIELTADENAQEIFETLNARGAQLTAADLIKNFIFQRLMEAGEDVEAIYEEHWREFETGFWETEVSSGRVRYPRSSMFLNQWLIAQTGEEIVAREVFTRFKRFADHDSDVPMRELVERLRRAADAYRDFVEISLTTHGPLDRVGLFAYRSSVLESEVVKPLLLWILDPEQSPIPPDQIDKALDVVESWMVRRMLVRATTKAYNQVVPELVTELSKSERVQAGDVVEAFLRGQTGDARYWPDDKELAEELGGLLAYRRLRRARLRMVFEAVEDHLRGWKHGSSTMDAERVQRGKLVIEHVMPRKWTTHWSPTGSPSADLERDRRIHTLGNLTLLTSRLNTAVSNGAWLGNKGKCSGLEMHDVLLVNRELLRQAGDSWTDQKIEERTAILAAIIGSIWQVPPGHTSAYARKSDRPRHRVDVADLITAGLLEPGSILWPRTGPREKTAIVLPDGRLDVGGDIFETPSGAATAIAGKQRNGWWFLVVEPGTRRSLRVLLRDYLEQMSVDVEDDDEIGDDEDDEG